jgi:signal transduction histidine kinase
MPEEIQVDTGFANRWAVQDELDRLAGEIHDGLTQYLTAICLQLLVAKELISSRGGNPLGNIQQAIELANLGLAEARRYVGNLRLSVVEKSGLMVTLQGLAERWTVPGRLRCEFRYDNVPESRLSDTSKHQLLRIAQEAVHNAVRHANPTLVTITLRWKTPNIVLEVRDNGVGISTDKLAKSEGFGLGNMRERARKLDGRIEIKTAPGQGTGIIVTVPPSAQEAATHAAVGTSSSDRQNSYLEMIVPWQCTAYEILGCVPKPNKCDYCRRSSGRPAGISDDSELTRGY